MGTRDLKRLLRFSKLNVNKHYIEENSFGPHLCLGLSCNMLYKPIKVVNINLNNACNDIDVLNLEL